MSSANSGPNNPAEYMVSGLPYVTSSTKLPASVVTEILFPMVTSWLLVRNHTATSTLRFGFTRASLHPSNPVHNHMQLHQDEQFQGDVRCKALYLSASLGTPSFTVMAGLTSIQPKQFPILTSSLTTSNGPASQGSGQLVWVYEGVG